jgi:hypothetical protein
MASRQAATTPITSAFEAEAEQLALWLRTRRFSVLLGTDGAERAALLKDGVMPRLRRRAGDVARAPASRVVVPFPERRRRAPDGSGTREVAVFFDGWGQAQPLAALLAAVHAALGVPPPPTDPAERARLADDLAALCARSGARLLLIFDRFEECPHGEAEAPQARAFVDELVEALNTPSLPVHLLVCASDEAGARLADVFARVPGTDEEALRLPPAPPPAAPESEADWLASVGAIVARVADLARHEPKSDPAPVAQQSAAPAVTAAEAPADTVPDAFEAAAWPVDGDEPAKEPVNEPVAEPPVEPVAESLNTEPRVTQVDLELDLAPVIDVAAAAEAVPQARETAPREVSPPEASPPEASPPEFPPRDAPLRDTGPTPSDMQRIPRLAWLGAACAAGLAAWFVWSPPPAADPPVAAPPIVRAEPPAPPAALPPTGVPPLATMEAPAAGPARNAGDDATLSAQLGAAVAGAGLPGAAVSWPAGFAPVPGSAALALARYDALQAARDGASRTPLRIVAPLYREALHFVVRADSPLRFVHDIRGAAINAGPLGSARALTVDAVYRRLFGAAAASSPGAALDEDAALGALLAGHGVDVMVVVEAPSAGWLARLPKVTRGTVRLLALDPARPETRRAQQAFLPLTLGAAQGWDGDTPALAELTFLVAADEPEGARAAAALCKALPDLRRTDAVWRELAPEQLLPTGWPVSAAITQVWQRCPAASR